MENLSMCRICLATDVRLCSIASHLRDMYEKITSMTFKKEEWRPLVACYICIARLQNCYRLRTSCLRSEELLTDMMSNNVIKPQDVLSTNTLRVESVLHFSTGQMLQNCMKCHVKEEASEIINNAEFDQQYTKNIMTEAQEGQCALIDDNSQCSHLEDTLYIMKREPDDVETDAEYTNLKDETITIEEHRCESDIAGPSLQPADNICPKIVKVVLERIDLYDTMIGARVSEKLAALKDTEDATTNRRKIEVIKKEQTESITIKEPNIVAMSMEVKNPVTTSKILKNCDKVDINVNKCEYNVLTSIVEDVCEEKSVNDTSLEQNVSSISSSKSKPFICDTCKKCFNRKDRLKTHIRIHTGDKPHQCNVCKKGFIEKSALKRHIRIHTGEKPHQCNVCKKDFIEKSDLKKHIRIHTGEKPYQCNVCNKCFRNKYYLKIHFLTHTGEKPYRCIVCNSSFSQKRNLETHIRKHTGDRSYECQVCKKCFIQYSDLKIHIRLHTGKNPYQCNVCNKCFSYKYLLKEHILTHTGEKPYQCNVCKKCFINKSSLIKHSRTHTGEKPYQCNVCIKCFSFKHHLKDHILTHTGEKLYRCNICKISFNRKGNLKTHIRIHTGDKPYQCNVCKKCFTQKVSLQTHIRTHTGDKPL